MKRVMIVARIVSMVALLAAPAVVQAQYSFTTNADGITVTLTGYSGVGGNITIPATNDTGLTVTSIGTNAFANLTNLTGVAIPGSVTEVGDSAFQNCYFLINATFANGLVSIGDYTFEACTSLTSVTIPGTVTNIGDSAFGNCYRLTNATLLNCLLSIGDSAFSGCISLTSIAIPAGVTNIGDSAFAGCTSLTNLIIPTSLTSIGNSVFMNCSALPKLTIPGSVTSIGDNAFSWCNHLTNMTIPASVTNFAADAFEATLLTSLHFQGNAPTISPPNGPPVGIPLMGTVYYLPGTTGWSNSFDGCPAVLWNPLIQTGDGSFGVQNGQFGFNITGTTNIPIVVEACANLAGPVWTPLQSLTLTNGAYYFSEPFQPGSVGRYYRISSQ